MLNRIIKVFSSKEGAVVIGVITIVFIVGFMVILFSLVGLPYPNL